MPYEELRRGRVSLTGQVYLVTSATANRQPLFADFHIGRCVVDALRKQDNLGNSRTIAFVVMPDHFHWLVQLVANISLAVLVRSVKGTSARKLNHLNQKPGPVWQPGFHDHAVRKNEQLEAVAQYVIMNPVRAGLVADVGDYALWDVMRFNLWM